MVGSWSACVRLELGGVGLRLFSCFSGAFALHVLLLKSLPATKSVLDGIIPPPSSFWTDADRRGAHITTDASITYETVCGPVLLLSSGPNNRTERVGNRCWLEVILWNSVDPGGWALCCVSNDSAPVAIR